MHAVAYGVLGVITLGLWVATQITWLRWLRHANGTRPFIALTLNIGLLSSIEALIFVLLIFNGTPSTSAGWVAGVAYRLVSIFICGLMWELHRRLHDFVRSGESE